MKKLLIVLLMLICLVGCNSNNEEKETENEGNEVTEPSTSENQNTEQKGENKVIEGNLINASQKARGEFGASSIELKDGKFTLTEIEGMGAVEVKGNYSQQGDILMFSDFDTSFYSSNGEELFNFEFYVVDKDTLELMKDLGGSKAGDCFSTSGNIPNSFIPKYKKEEVACTGLKSPYNYYWAIANPVNTYNLEVEVYPEDCTEVVEYAVDDVSVATVDQNGNITPGNVGKTVVHVTCGNQKLDITVESKPKTVKLEKIEMADIVLKVGEDAQVKPVFYPENTTDKTLSYESSDSYRVSVNTDGKVVALKPGPCDIYVKASDGNTYTCHVMVEGEYLDIDLPLYSEVSYSEGNYAPCHVYLHSYEDGQENITEVWHEATLHSEGGEVEIVGDKLFAHADPGGIVETKVWFTYKDYSTIKVTIYVKP